jgi:hypothetical protein
MVGQETGILTCRQSSSRPMICKRAQKPTAIALSPFASAVKDRQLLLLLLAVPMVLLPPHSFNEDHAETAETYLTD